MVVAGGTVYSGSSLASTECLGTGVGTSDSPSRGASVSSNWGSVWGFSGHRCGDDDDGVAGLYSFEGSGFGARGMEFHRGFMCDGANGGTSFQSG
ncbi:unnamed protein product [Camellia sinensis]